MTLDEFARNTLDRKEIDGFFEDRTGYIDPVGTIILQGVIVLVENIGSILNPQRVLTGGGCIRASTESGLDASGCDRFISFL